MEEGRATAIVLAAGESRRMGERGLKPLLPYGSGTVIQAVVRSLEACPVAPVLVVLGHRADEIAPHLAGTGAQIVLNPAYHEGMLSSVAAGISAAPSDTGWFLIALGDQPSLRPETVRLLLDTARAGSHGIVVPSYDHRRGHPLLIHRRFREEIAGLPRGGGLRELMRRHPDAIAHVTVPTDAVLRDMDTPEEYERELQRLREGPG